METWFISDTHFGHRKILTLCNRPYKSMEEMDEDLIKKWNDKVSNKDVIYHMGDFAWKHVNAKYRNRLNGNIHLIQGNHDILKGDDYKLFGSVSLLKVLNFDGQAIALCHYPILHWPKSHRGAWHLYGHVHGKYPCVGKSHDVGVDVNGFKPLHFEEIRELMKHKEFHEHQFSTTCFNEKEKVVTSTQSDPLEIAEIEGLQE
jgi:calcineurin-like phosphoesterase family protein